MDEIFTHESFMTTILPEPLARETVLTLYDVFIPLLGIFIISLNLLVVISSGLLLKKRQEPRSTYLFLGNVGLSDLLTGVAVLFGHFYPRERRCETSCAIQLGMIVSSTLVSVLSVLLVAIDRFLYILYGLKYQQYVYPTRARLLILTTWILGGVTGFLPAMVPSLRGSITRDQCWFILLNPGLILGTTIVGIVPILIIFILYSIILYKALKKVSELKKATSGTGGTETANNLRYFRGSTVNLNQVQDQDPAIIPLRQPSNNALRWCCWKSKQPATTVRQTLTSNKQPSKWKAIKIVMLTTISFMLTWVPYFVASTMFIYCDPVNNPNYCNALKIAIASPLAILGFTNSLLNPIIYAWWHNSFRTNSIRIWAKRCENQKCFQWCFNKSKENSSSHDGTNSLSARTTNLSSTSNLSPVASNVNINPNNNNNTATTIAIMTPHGSDFESSRTNLLNDANQKPSANSARNITSDDME